MTSLPIFFINLDFRPDRRAFMEGQFASLGLEGERISAVTPKDLSAEEIAASCNPHYRNYLRPVELACSLSHEKAWRAFLATHATHAIIFEDDAVLSSRLPEFLADLGPPRFGLIRFETSSRRLRILPPVQQVGSVATLRPFRSWEGGCGGYIISRSVAELLIASGQHRSIHVDIALHCPFRSVVPSSERVLSDPGFCIQLINMAEPEPSLTRSDINTAEPAPHLYRAEHPWRWRLDDARRRLQKTLDHIANLPRGLERKTIPFIE